MKKNIYSNLVLSLKLSYFMFMDHSLTLVELGKCAQLWSYFFATFLSLVAFGIRCRWELAVWKEILEDAKSSMYPSSSYMTPPTSRWVCFGDLSDRTYRLVNLLRVDCKEPSHHDELAIIIYDRTFLLHQTKNKLYWVEDELQKINSLTEIVGLYLPLYEARISMFWTR